MPRQVAACIQVTVGLVNMKIPHSSLVLALFGASLVAIAQQPPSVPPQSSRRRRLSQPAAAPAPAAAARKQPNRADAYYHFQLGHIDEDMAAVSGRDEYATKAVDEYKAALADDPNSPYLATALAELYARTGDIHDAVKKPRTW